LLQDFALLLVEHDLIIRLTRCRLNTDFHKLFQLRCFECQPVNLPVNYAEKFEV
jgi:hypothetical protein